MNLSAAPVITIDGPSGAGKGTVCARLAQVFPGTRSRDIGLV